MSIARVIYPFLLIAALLSATAHAEWSNEFGPTGFGSSSRPEAVVDYGGQLVVAGRFSNAGRDRVEKVARWDGSRWIQLGSGPRNISCLAVYGGSLVAGGSFAALDSMFSSGLARWDGEGWRGLPGGLAGDVHALVVFEGGLYVGGRFALEAGSTIRHLARWDGQRWHAVGHGIAGGGRTRVEALAVHDGSLIVGGVFNRAGTADAMNLAAWDGTAWRSFGEGPDDVVSAIQGHGDRLYIGGSFNNVSGVAATSVACWSGGQWSGMSGGLGREYQTRPEVNAMVVWREKLIVGGRFDSAGGRRARAIASWDGSAWQSELPEFFTSPTYPGQLSVADLMVFGGRLVAVGEIPGGEGFLLNNLGLWDGKRWDPLVTGQGVGGGLMELKRLADQVVLECGTGAGARNVFGPAVWGDGQWEPYPGPAAGSPGLDVDLKLITEVGDRVVGFGRMPVGNPPERRERPELAWHLAQWDGGRWAPTSPRSPFGLSWAHGAVAFRDTVCVFGDFSEGDDRDYPGLLFDGDAWRPISRPDPAASLRRTVVVGDRLYAAWTVKSVGDTLRGLVTVLNGTNWSVLKATEHCEPTALGGWGAELVVAVSDPFEMMSESTRIQAWNGREWRPVPGDFRGRAGRPGGIDALAGYKGHLVASGIYAGIDGVACRNVGWWDGELWRPLEGGVSYQAYRMVATENSLWLAGSFKEAGDFPSEHVARWDGPLPVPEVLPAFEPEMPVVPQRKASAASASPEVEEVPGLFANGEFRAWTDSTPAHWRWQARAGSGCELPVIGPVRALEGGVTIQSPACGEFAATLSQIFEIARGTTFRVRARYSFHGAADQTERRRAMLVLGDYKVSPDGKRSWSEHSQSHTPLQNGADNVAEIVLRTAPEATQASVDFSITGEDLTLTVHEVTVEVIPFSTALIVSQIIEGMDAAYVPQSDRERDWGAALAACVEIDTTAAFGPERFISAFLTALGDPRVTLRSGHSDMINISHFVDFPPVPEGERVTRERGAVIERRLMDWTTTGGSGVGWTRDGLAYLRLTGSGLGSETWADLATAEGLIIDLRNSESTAGMSGFGPDHVDRFAGRFFGVRTPYAITRTLSGDVDTLVVEPAPDRIPDVPIVCLIGAGCRGAGAEIALALSRRPGVVFVGTPTCGGRGGRGSVPLATGSQLEFPDRSLWTMDGKLVSDDHGIEPDVLVVPTGPLDPVFDVGVATLRNSVR